MTTVRFGRTGIAVPRISLGTWAYGGENVTADGYDVGWSGHDAAQARAALRRAYELGVTHWDTADVYGNGRSEELLGGMWTEIPRDRIFLATKVGWYKGKHFHYYDPDLVREQLEGSLRRLRTDRIDLYYLHHCDFGRNFESSLEIVLAAKKAGKIRFVGLSDWDDRKIMKYVDRVNPDVVQPYRNVTHDTFESSGLKAWVEQHDAGVAFFSPLRHGLLLGKYDRPHRFPRGDHRNNDAGFRDPELLADLKRRRDELARKYGDVLGALVGAILADAPTACALVGQRSPGQVEAAAKAAALRLDPADAAWVRELYRPPAE